MYRDNGQFLVAYDQNKPDGLTRTNPWRRETQNRSYTKPRHDQDWIGYQINGEKTKNKNKTIAKCVQRNWQNLILSKNVFIRTSEYNS